MIDIYNTALVSLGYVLSPDKTKVLMLYHNANSSDISYGKFNGYSDFVRNNESPYESFVRAVAEQTGLIVRKAEFRGDVLWPNFRDQGKSFFSQIFITTDYEGIPKQYTDKGKNQWWTISQVLRGDVPIWDGDKHFLPLVFDNKKEPFHGYMPYERGVPKGWFFKRG